MSETYNLKLPLILPGQAQKHVTVNEALAMLDAVAQLRLVARGVNTPPNSPVDGAAWDVGQSPTGLWAGQAGDRQQRWLGVCCTKNWLALLG